MITVNKSTNDEREKQLKDSEVREEQSQGKEAKHDCKEAKGDIDWFHLFNVICGPTRDVASSHSTPLRKQRRALSQDSSLGVR